MIQVFTPSSTDLHNMIAAAEAKFAASRQQCLREQAERAFAYNARVIREQRANDVRRVVNAGDRA